MSFWEVAMFGGIAIVGILAFLNAVALWWVLRR